MASIDPDFNKSLWLFFQQIKGKRQANTHGSIIRKSNTNFFDILFRKLAKKRRVKYISTLLAYQYRERGIWMRPRTDAWFVMVDISLDDQTWYANFRVSRHTFQFILDQIEDDIVHENTRLRKQFHRDADWQWLCTIWQALLNIAQLQICSEFPRHLFVFA